ncbi:unnamed protein product, partial [Sphacelaria rigidula]
PTSGRAAAPRASWGAEVATAQADMQRLIAEMGSLRQLVVAGGLAKRTSLPATAGDHVTAPPDTDENALIGTCASARDGSSSGSG